MTAKEERKLLNQWISKRCPISAEAKRIVGQKARTIRRKKLRTAWRKWKSRNWLDYRTRLQQRKAARSRKQKDSPSPRFVPIRAQHCAITNFFLCQKP